jgi:hypothetical protein
MKKIYVIISIIILASYCLSAQNYKPITVKAGSRVIEYFPYKDRYMYTDFKEGNVLFKSGRVITNKFNYNFLINEMQFIQSGDTLSISNSNKKDIRFITIEQDTFYIRDHYLKQIHSGNMRVFENQDIILKDILKKGAMGTVNRSSASESFNSISLTGNIYELRPEEDWVFQKTPEFYYSLDYGDFEMFTRKNVLQLFPGKDDDVKNFLKANKVNFESREDILKLTDFLSGLH